MKAFYGILKILLAFGMVWFMNIATNALLGMEYYMLVIAVGVASLAVYVYVARKYKLRERDKPCHVCRFVEDYSSKMPEKL